MMRARRTAVVLAAAGVLIAAAAAPVRGQAPAISLDGVVDLHVHAGPDSRPRAMDDLAAARMAADAGLRGILLKNHFTMTADRAAIAMRQVPGLEIFGGVVLNRAVGGINPEAVRQMAAFSGGRGKVVWLPTFDAEHYVRSAAEGDTSAGGGSASAAGAGAAAGGGVTSGAAAGASPAGGPPFVSVTADGEPLPAVLEVFDLLGEHDLTLATGHIAPAEVLRLIPEAQQRGVRRILVTHVFSQGPTQDQMRQMAAAGAILEIDWLAVRSGSRPLADYVTAIRTLGADAFALSSDLGQAGNPPHADGLRAFIRALLDAGVSQAEIDVMARRNPARLLGLEP